MNEFETFIKEQKAKTSNEKKKKTSKDLAKGFNIKQNPKDVNIKNHLNKTFQLLTFIHIKKSF